MTQVDTLDLVVLVVILVGSVAYFTKGSLWGVVKDPYATAYSNANGAKAGASRDIIEKLDETGKNCVIFYGSQTGTAEDYASRLAKEGSQRFGLKTMVADLEDYDYENLDKFPEDKVMFFVLATYGEGEPTDNAVDFYQFITSDDVSFEGGGTSDDKPLSSIRYVAFGLGNNTYEHYNSMVRNVDATMKRLGAKRIGEAGEGDDGAGTMEEDYLAWKEPMWKALAEEMGLEEREAVYEPVFSVIEEPETSPEADHIASQYMNIAQALQSVTPLPFTSVPFSLLIEGIPKIQPRYYSISSSSLVQKNKISITAIVESLRIPGATHNLKGVTTNYLLALKQKQHGDPNPDPHGLTYAINGPRNKYDGIHVPIHVRHSNFKLPSDPAKPVIMVGPGTGVAPFRGFIQERAAQAERGDKVGPTILFYGCRRREEDFLYKDEWDTFASKLGSSLQIITAFSRETSQKVYVQHKLREHAELVNELLLQKGNFYVCGDAANMAREVNVVLGQIMAEQRGLAPEKGEELVKHMRNNGSYQEDVWS
ncbi:NADPH-cytochrome P450 reductase [Paracoccidioides lutzii Pb01]|uniref:NADPH--hemoprotein reductase n=1 Tax=Paracoccidioides lutzii (strain ATCC MYA-826 / Pb01) TaxID=502779 RepID=A0A0A2V600_PARBA|nr:NADPH-cytochrome P450 reductase [Paracoccidioides lutzii Pb01]KGQ01545.1 NADPH-cytochrome P450 reductase [Paracoccidioides lutzii Pb01]